MKQRLLFEGEPTYEVMEEIIQKTKELIER